MQLRRRRAAAAPRRDAADAAADPARGQLLRRPEPGSPSAGEPRRRRHRADHQTVDRGARCPRSCPCCRRDTRGDLQTLLREYGTEALGKGGAEALNGTIPYFEPAYRLHGAHQRRAAGRAADARPAARAARPDARVRRRSPTTRRRCEDLVTDLNTTAGALARQDDALAASVPALRDTLRVGYPALGELNDALPTLRAFSIEALPGVRSSVPTLDAAIPWIVQARGLVREDELQGLAADLRQAVPSLVRLNHRLIPALRQLRGAVVVHELRAGAVRRVEHPQRRGRQLRPGGAQADHAQLRRPRRREPQQRRQHARLPRPGRQPAEPDRRARSSRPRRSSPNTPPPHRPDVPCETQAAAQPRRRPAAPRSTRRSSTPR